jgi:NADH-quinone oxidoreductase subunit M
MKLGAYGCFRAAMVLFPQGLEYWRWWIAWLAVAGIVYGAAVALVQKDFKFIIGYSSVSHMGFVMLGLAAANATAVSGAVLQMFSHGVIAGLLFAVVGRMVYERTHTRQLADLRKLPLHRLMPFAALTFVLAGMASMGMPGFSGFPAELTILIGAWKTSPAWATFAGGGVLVAAAFTLRVMQISFFGTTDHAVAGADTDHAHSHALPCITWPERFGAMLLIAATVYVGLKPDVLLNWITPALQSPLMKAALTGGAP